MAKFITGNDLEKAIYDIIWDVEKTLMIVSPFIKLDNYFKKLFDKHTNNPKIHFIIVFGKNEGFVSKSLSKSDFDYFKKFFNVSIVYAPNLHAKYYGNETRGVVTSINLHDYSFKNNIEFGIFSEVNLLNKFTPSTDQVAWNECYKIAEKHEAVFIKRPVYDRKLLSSLLGSNYIKSDILHDVTEKFYSSVFFSKTKSSIKTLSDFPEFIELGSHSIKRPTREEVENNYSNKGQDARYGFCIRTGVKIPFNPSRPLSEQAYKSWSLWGNVDFQEAYCHKTGEKSNGNTSMRNPILRKNW
jgi:hypothetical protein